MHAAFALAAIAAAVSLTYASALQGGWLLWDDASYVYRNELVTSYPWPRVIRAAFCTFQCSNYHPLTMLSHAIVWRLAGEAAFWHRLVNLAFHAVNGFLVYLLLRRLTRHAMAALGLAVWFAVHPALASAVAWIAERKEVLATFGYLMAVWIWTCWQVKPSTSLWTLVAASLALLSKPTAVTLPVVLLAWDRWLRKGWQLHRVAALATMGIGAAVIAVLTVAAQAETAIQRLAWPHRIAAVAHSLPWYVSCWLLPLQLSPHHPVYPHWTSWDEHAWIGIGLMLAWVTAIWRLRHKHPVAAWGLAWSLLVWIPISGFVPVGRAAVAERYLYLMAPGWLVAFAYAVAQQLPTLRPALRWLAAGAGLSGLAWLATTTYTYAAVWGNDEALWKWVLAKYPDSSLAKLNLGAYYSQVVNRPEEARRLFESISSDDVDGQFALAHINLLVLELQERPTDPVLLSRLEAFAHGDVPRPGELGGGVIELGPVERRLALQAAIGARVRAARVLVARGRLAAAERHLRRALALDPSHPEALYLLALTLAHRGRPAEANRVVRDLLRRADVPDRLRELAVDLARAVAPSDQPRTALEPKPSSTR